MLISENGVFLRDIGLDEDLGAAIVDAIGVNPAPEPGSGR